MILRDQFGEVEAGLGDIFHYKGAELEIVTPDSIASELFGYPIVCCRLRKGQCEHDGELLRLEEGKPAPFAFFDHDGLATCLRQQRKSESVRPDPFPLSAEFDALVSAPLDKPEKATGSGKKSKARPDQDQPTLW